MNVKIILGIQVKKTANTGVSLQSILSKYGGVIKTRLGLNEVVGDHATTEGLILLELSGDPNDCQRLENELLSLDNLDIKKMVFQQ